MKDTEKKSLDPQLWHACAGGMVQMPPVSSNVVYFPQGHAEHASAPVDFSASPRIPPLILCRVAAVKFLADPDTDEVYSKIRLVPLPSNDLGYDDDGVENPPEKPTSFAKTLTQSDANNGGGFSVPRYCAETIFPRLDYSADPPVQTVVAKDVHGEVWKFRHIYRGTPRRHLLTTGWSTFVNQKKLVAGDSIVFLRAENGDLCVGIRRAKRGIGGGSSGWNSTYGGFSVFDENKLIRTGNPNLNGGFVGKGRVRAESVIEAANLAAIGHPFEVAYYPRACTPEFCINASSVRAAIRIQWCPRMRFKMAFETEDSSRISWFMGTIASVQVADHIRWPNSPWRLLRVTWDEPDLLRNVERVSPWLVELVSNMNMPLPVINLSPPRKKLRVPEISFSGNPNPNPLLRPSSSTTNAPAGIQGARQTSFGISLSDLHYNNKLQSGLFRSSFQHFDPRRNDNLACLLTMGSSTPNPEKSEGVKKKHQFLLFGQPILTEQQMSSSSSGDTLVTANCLPNNAWKQGEDTGHCKVFMESEDVGRTLDLSALASYEELYRRLAQMFGRELLNHVLYQDAMGTVRQVGHEPFSDFIKSAKRLTILMDSASTSSKMGRTWITGLESGDSRLDSSNKRGPLGIFA